MGFCTIRNFTTHRLSLPYSCRSQKPMIIMAKNPRPWSALRPCFQPQNDGCGRLASESVQELSRTIGGDQFLTACRVRGRPAGDSILCQSLTAWRAALEQTARSLPRHGMHAIEDGEGLAGRGGSDQGQPVRRGNEESLGELRGGCRLLLLSR